MRISIDEAIILGLVDIEERLRAENAGIVKQNIEAPKPIERDLHHRLTDRRHGNIPDMSDSFLPGGIDRLDSGLGLGAIAAVHDDEPAFGDEPAGHLLADAGIATCDDRDLILKTHLLISFR